MATYKSNVAGDTTPAKSGVRDLIRVPFVCTPGAALGLNDVLQLAKVSAGHRVVGYYVETVTAPFSGGSPTVALRVNDGGTPLALLSGSSFISAAGSVASHTGARTGAGAAVTTPGTFETGNIPTPDTMFAKDGTFELVVTAAGTGGQPTVKFSGYIEIQPA